MPMSFFKFVKHQVGKLVYALFSFAPRSWERKFSILMDVLSADPRRLRKLPAMTQGFQYMPNLEDWFSGLDADSLSTLRRFVAKLHFMADSPHLYASPPPPYAFLWGGLCTREEYDEALENEKRLEELKTRLHLCQAEASSLIYHHGLRFLPQQALSYIQDTLFIDAGAFEGDSTLAFLHYKPRIVWAFEPSPPSQEMFLATMKANGVSESAFCLCSQGLSDQNATIRFSARATGDCSLTGKGRCTAQLVTLDSLTPPTRIGLIKADLEGMGMSMLRGAVQTIRRDKPVLSLSFYHNTDEFLNTYQFVKALGLPYEYKVLSLCPPWENHDLTLLAWPADLN